MIDSLILGVIKGIVENENMCAQLDNLAKFTKLNPVSLTVKESSLVVEMYQPCIDNDVDCKEAIEDAKSDPEFRKAVSNFCSVVKCVADEVFRQIKKMGPLGINDVVKKYSHIMPEQLMSLFNQFSSISSFLFADIKQYKVERKEGSVYISFEADMSTWTKTLGPEIVQKVVDILNTVLNEGCEGVKKIVSQAEE